MVRGLMLHLASCVNLLELETKHKRRFSKMETKVAKNYAEFYNHEEGPYKGLLLVESAY